MPTSLDHDEVRHTKQHRFDEIVLPDDCVGNLQYNSADPLSLANQRHQVVVNHGQAHGVAATTERRVKHVARGAGDAVGVQAGPVAAAAGDSTVTVDVLKNGATVLTGVITINSTHAAYAKVPGVIAAAAYAAGDVFEFVFTATAGTGTLPQGVWADLILDEAAA